MNRQARLLVWAVMAGAACAVPAGAKDFIAPATERQLDGRIAYFRQEAEGAPCSIADPVCAMGKYKLILAAALLAQEYPVCAAGDQGCRDRKAARGKAADAAADMIGRETAELRRNDLAMDVYAGKARPDAAAAQAYVDRVRAYLAASNCPEEQKVCVAGELLYLVEIDQLLRRQVIPCLGLPATAQRDCQRHIGAEIVKADAASTQALLRIVGKAGWPDSVHWGAETENNAWLLAQHADQNQKAQARFLASLKASFARGFSPASDYAYLADRQAVAHHRPQRYGTQGMCEGEGSARHWTPDPIEDEAHLIDRRTAAGLEALMTDAAYRRTMDAMCRGTF